jgi:pimeloyl-ACP methyl ester carboxylesterase
VRGLYQSFTTVYPQLVDLDLREEATTLDVPIYMVLGRWDVNAIPALAEEYFNMIDAPHKQLIWFEDSAHTPSWDEPQHFTEVMVNTVLAETYPQPNFER